MDAVKKVACTGGGHLQEHMFQRHGEYIFSGGSEAVYSTARSTARAAEHRGGRPASAAPGERAR